MARSTLPNLAVPEPSLTEVSGRPTVYSLLIALRPHQWTKNLLVFAGVVFARRLFDPSAAFAALQAFAIFCGLSGVVYLMNDVADREIDRQHPVKRRRPIAAGALSVPAAMTAAAVIAAVSLAAAFAMSWRFGLVAAAYLALLGLYSGGLKHIIIIDVLTVAIGFVLRAVAGAVAVGVAISHWLVVCTGVLGVFIALAKSPPELGGLGGGAAG